MNSFNARTPFVSNGKNYIAYMLSSLGDISRLPYSFRVLLECLLRTEGQGGVTADDIRALANWNPQAEPSKEIAFTPARVLLQDFTGVPCVVDLAAMREATAALGGDPSRVNPLQPVELVIDHSVQVDAYGSQAALEINRDLEFQRNNERYRFLKWGQLALRNFRAVPPNTGIVHQVNLEYLARVVFVNEQTGEAYPDSLVGTDSHTTMINGLGVLGWGVGGIEAEAAMLGQPVSMLIPQVIGFRLSGKLKEGVTATDLVLTVTEMLRKKGVVGKFVEFYGPGLSSLPVADRATLSNMAPEYGATCGFFPIDSETLRYLRMTGRDEDQVQLVETYSKKQGLFREDNSPEPIYTDTLQLDLSEVEPSVAGPKRPQDRLRLSEVAASYPSSMGSTEKLDDGSVVIAAITSCTNTSNPSVMIAAGLLAQNAAAKGLKPKPWVKTSLAPGSRVVTAYLQRANLLKDLESIGFNVTGYGCTTCIGNSGPLPDEVAKEVRGKNLTVAAVLSGNRNFEGRISPDVKANYLMSPPLVVAYALAGSMAINLQTDSLGQDANGNPVYLKDIWPTNAEVADIVVKSVGSDLFASNYADVFKGDERWAEIDATGSLRYSWPESTYVKLPPYFEGMTREAPTALPSLKRMRALAMLGDSITTDHISPAGNIKVDSPAGCYLIEHGIEPKMFNSYGSRRGNHEVMVRGTFANVRLRNQLAPGTEGGFTTYFPTGEVTSIFEASEKYRADGTPLMVLAGKEYGSGSSRDWGAKGPYLLGVKAVLAQSFERIHRSNLIGMGILPIQYLPGQNAATLGLSGKETFEVVGLEKGFGELPMTLTVKADEKSFEVLCRIDTPQEAEYYRHGGILQYVLRKLL
jgi:aconitate hydratase